MKINDSEIFRLFTADTLPPQASNNQLFSLLKDCLQGLFLSCFLFHSFFTFICVNESFDYIFLLLLIIIDVYQCLPHTCLLIGLRIVRATRNLSCLFYSLFHSFSSFFFFFLTTIIRIPQQANSNLWRNRNTHQRHYSLIILLIIPTLIIHSSMYLFVVLLYTASLILDSNY